MTVIHLRRVIAGLVNEIVQTETAPPELMEQVRKTMKQCSKCLLNAPTNITFLASTILNTHCNSAQALRDLQYMLEQPSHNARVSKYMKSLLYMSPSPNLSSDGALLSDAGLVPHPNKFDNLDLHISDYTDEGGFYDRTAKAGEATQAFLNRLWMALFGGIVLIAPMLIMRLHPTLVTELVVTSAFVLAFAVVLARFMVDAEGKDIIGATAAYAAVLVVLLM